MRLLEMTSCGRRLRPRSLIDRWAQALGVPQDRLATLVGEVVQERQALGTVRNSHRERRLIAQPIE